MQEVTAEEQLPLRPRPPLPLKRRLLVPALSLGKLGREPGTLDPPLTLSLPAGIHPPGEVGLHSFLSVDSRGPCPSQSPHPHSQARKRTRSRPREHTLCWEKAFLHQFPALALKEVHRARILQVEAGKPREVSISRITQRQGSDTHSAAFKFVLLTKICAPQTNAGGEELGDAKVPAEQ